MLPSHQVKFLKNPSKNSKIKVYKVLAQFGIKMSNLAAK